MRVSVAGRRSSIELFLRRTLVRHNVEQRCTIGRNSMEVIKEIVLKGERKSAEPGEIKKIEDLRILGETIFCNDLLSFKNSSLQIRFFEL